MVSTLNPYLGFGDNARPALEFYRDVFGGTLRISTFGEFGDKDAPGADLVMHGQLETPSGYTLMASDTPPGMEYEPGSAISISLSGDAAEELRGYWGKLIEGGVVTVPLEKQMWGDEFGMCRDRFGISWMVNISPVGT
ncbi:VOC family protein [Nocardia puris]|uniref:PhnB protein n=1 Tax=Nocardia puris TaxID=208602 RepID=A0A366DVU4_9NOCA|nr:VOC family protein [Nocardia puris]MBF6210032.1 VOC family protein [Nocardia puris]MBF6368223.1 VOC family protein [Nocardia puris]MBF6458058.1 VOC family protein [Nocardia puris]RBO94221.1 PhnB protein [Nocardia puris]